jgi:hypothetical protein
MDSQTWPPAPDVAYPRIIGANGPKQQVRHFNSPS